MAAGSMKKSPKITRSSPFNKNSAISSLPTVSFWKISRIILNEPEFVQYGYKIQIPLPFKHEMTE